MRNRDDYHHQNFRTDAVGKWLNHDRIRRHDQSQNPYWQGFYFRKYVEKNKDLPVQLKELLTPLKCNLCCCTMGSTVSAKGHYEGKKHISNIRKWISSHPEYLDKNCTTMEDQSKIVDVEKLYCSYCDVTMSSEHQAESHYSGKKHQNILNSRVRRSTFYNSDLSIWERCKTDGETNVQLRMGINFWNISGREKETSINQKFCESCQVVCSSHTTFCKHLNGSKHKKKTAISHCSEGFSGFSSTKDNILQEVLKKEKKIPSPADLSIYRTPSGKYYCHSCNITVNSPIQFIQHSESRKHKYKSNCQSTPKFR